MNLKHNLLCMSRPRTDDKIHKSIGRLRITVCGRTVAAVVFKIYDYVVFVYFGLIFNELNRTYDRSLHIMGHNLDNLRLFVVFSKFRSYDKKWKRNWNSLYFYRYVFIICRPSYRSLGRWVSYTGDSETNKCNRVN